MWRYKVQIKNRTLNEWDSLYYVSRSPSFNIHTLINQNNGLDDNNFMLYEDGSLSWCNRKGYFKYDDAIDLLQNIDSIHISKI